MSTFTELSRMLHHHLADQEDKLKILANYREMMGEVDEWSDSEVEDPTQILPKLKEQQKEILSLMSLRSKDSEKLATLHNEVESLKELCMGMCQQLEDATKHEVKDPEYYYRGIQAVKDLKEENEALRQQIDECRKEVDESKTIQDKLNGENQNYKEILEELRDYMERIGENEVKVFDKIVKGEDEVETFLTTSDEEEDEKEGEFNHFNFEMADTDNNIEFFNRYKKQGYLDAMKAHRKMTSCFDWTNFDKWVGEGELPTPLLPYPRKKEEVIGEYPDCQEEIFDAGEDSIDQMEKDVIKEYFSKNKPRSIEAVRHYCNTYYQFNSMVEYIKNLPEDKFRRAYWGMCELMKFTAIHDKERVKIIGNILNDEGGIDLMRASYYLFCWDTKQAGMIVLGYYHHIEYWWSGIGEWLA